MESGRGHALNVGGTCHRPPREEFVFPPLISQKPCHYPVGERERARRGALPGEALHSSNVHKAIKSSRSSQTCGFHGPCQLVRLRNEGALRSVRHRLPVATRLGLHSQGRLWLPLTSAAHRSSLGVEAGAQQGLPGQQPQPRTPRRPEEAPNQGGDKRTEAQGNQRVALTAGQGGSSVSRAGLGPA